MKANIKDISFIGVMSGIILVLGFTPVGMIPMGYITMTLLHIPVIIGTIVAGRKTGIALGAVMGLATIFNAFGMSLSGPTWLPQTLWTLSPFAVIVMSMVPRILIAFVTDIVYTSIEKGSKPKFIGLNKLRSSRRLPAWAKTDKMLAIVYAAVCATLANDIVYFGIMGLFSLVVGYGEGFKEAITPGVIWFVVFENMLAVFISVIAVNYAKRVRNENKSVYATDTALLNKKLTPDPDVIEEPLDDFEGVSDEPVAVVPSADSICPVMEFSLSKIHDKAMTYLERGAVAIAETLFDKLMQPDSNPETRLSMGVYIVDRFVESGEYQIAAKKLEDILQDTRLEPYWNDEYKNTVLGLFSIINRAMLENPAISEYQTERMALAYNKIRNYITAGAWILAGQVFRSYISLIPIA